MDIKEFEGVLEEATKGLKTDLADAKEKAADALNKYEEIKAELEKILDLLYALFVIWLGITIWLGFIEVSVGLFLSALAILLVRSKKYKP